MDTKRVSDERYFHQLHEIYKHKFRNLSFDVIISSDDNAFNFLRKHRDEIFPYTPVVFCGVNFFKGSDLEGHDLFTGVNEEADFKAGIEIALRLHPDSKRIVVINDTTTTGMKIHEKLMEIIADYKDSVGFVLLEDIEMEKIQGILQGLPPDSVVFYTSFYRDKSGKFFEYDESISLIAKRCNVPIYAAWDFNLGYGVVGGMLTSGYYQGEAAAKLALRILGGEMVTDIPVIKESPNRYMFDYSQLDRFGIRLSDLPTGSIVINKPYSFYSVHKGLVWGVFASIAGLTFIILILSINIFKRKQAEERLKEAHEELEERVFERTKELDRTNKQLNLELTERKRAEEALKESEEKYRTQFEEALDAIFIADAGTGILVDCNPAGSKLVGRANSELIGKHQRILHPPEEVEGEFTKTFKQHLIEKEGEALEAQVIRKNGEIRDVSIKANIFKFKGKKVLQGIFRDITSQKRAEEEKEKLQAQLSQAQKIEAIGTLAGGIAHNFNNLLMSVMGNTSLMLLETDSNHPNYERLENIEKSIQNGSRLTRQLLGCARKGGYEIKPISLNQLVKETSDTFVMAKKEIRAHLELGKDLCGIKADQGQIEQVLLNLYVNAADALPGGGDLFLKTMNVTDKDMRGKTYKPKPGNYVLLTVTDAGIGMDKKTIERIFDPFFTTKGLAKGTGLGLASVYGIIKAHGGYIDVDSEKAKGTTFSIYLPATEKEVKEEREVSGELLKGKGTVLLVDDEDMVLDAAEQMLRKLGYEVLLTKGGREALELYKKNQDRIDMVLLDMVMPGMGGGEAYDRMKEINPKVKVLLSSGYSIDGQYKSFLKMAHKTVGIQGHLLWNLSWVYHKYS